MTNVGVLGQGALARVDERGAFAVGDLALDWWVGADDRWHVPAREVSTRRRRIGPAPVVETAVRVPGGEVVERVYAAAAPGAVVVTEVDNQSAAPLTVVLVVRIARPGRVEVDGSALRVDGVAVMAMSRAPGGWASGAGEGEGSTEAIVTGGRAQTGPIGTLDGPTDLALLFPVPHRTCVRVALGRVSSGEPGAPPIDVRDLPDADAVAKGWDRQLERGLQAELPPPIGDAVDTARVDLLLSSPHDPAVVAALEDWGFDDEAVAAWSRLGWRARRRARRRDLAPDPWPVVRALDPGRDPARFLSAVRATLVREQRGVIELLPGFPPDWLGQSVTVDAAPLRAGALSFAVRWHGARPALLWDAPAGIELRAPALDPGWSMHATSGEALLAEPPARLLPMGSGERTAGETVDAPGQFT